jgi:hypothetical protein
MWRFFFAILLPLPLVCLDFSVSIAEKAVWAIALFRPPSSSRR